MTATSPGDDKSENLDWIESICWGFFRKYATTRKLKFASCFIVEFLMMDCNDPKLTAMNIEEQDKEICNALVRLSNRKMIKSVTMPHKGRFADDEEYRRPKYRIVAYRLF